MNNEHRTSDTRTARHARYGLNVAVAAAVVIVLVVLANWLAYNQFYYRADLTATRQYTLSQQTQNVLGELDGRYRVATLFREGSAELDQVRDLVDEYARYAPNLTAEHLNPDLQITRRQRLLGEVHDHFADRLEPTEQAVSEARDALTGLGETSETLIASLTQVLDEPAMAEAGSSRQRIQRVVANLRHTAGSLPQLLDRIDEVLAQPLPDYPALIQHELERHLEDMRERLLEPAIAAFEREVDRGGLPGDVQNELLRAVRQMEPVAERLEAALRQLRLAEPVDEYSEILQALQAGQLVMILGPDTLRVIPADHMYRQLPDDVAEQTGRGGRQFLGEERLTGSLISMTMDQPPLVVFVNRSQRPALGQRGQYQHVASRLESAHFEVREWNPLGQGGMPQAGGEEPDEPPQPEPGQPVVWVVLPHMEQQQMQLDTSGIEQLAEQLEQRLEQGDGVLTMLTTDPAARHGEAGPIAQLVRDWGIHAQLDRVVLREIQHGGGRTQPSGEITVHDWPQGLPVTQALGGLRAVFVHTNPLVVRSDAPEHVTHHSLIELSGDRLWAEPNLEQLQTARFDPGEAAGRYTIGLAAEAELDGDDRPARLIAVADPYWAHDQITTMGAGQAGAADVMGADFPANSELFVNSVYWLAGYDGLIAASPRAQDIRRIAAMDDRRLLIYRTLLLAGLPGVVALAGVGVWLARRRG